jgi:hypothetical protein
MSHEQSETIQRLDGRWINVYGKGTPHAGRQLPDTQDYSTVEEAVSAAQTRSNSSRAPLSAMADPAFMKAYISQMLGRR